MTYRTVRAGFQVREVPIMFVDRRVGLSKMSGSIFFEALTLVQTQKVTRFPLVLLGSYWATRATRTEADVDVGAA